MCNVGISGTSALNPVENMVVEVLEFVLLSIHPFSSLLYVFLPLNGCVCWS